MQVQELSVPELVKVQLSEVHISRGPRLLPETANSVSRRLCRAAVAGNWDLVTAILASGADINQPVTTWGHTLLHFAAQGVLYRAADRTVDVVSSLLNFGADVGAVDARGNTPLHAAATGGWSRHYVDGMKALVAAGADVAAMNLEGHMPLHIAAARGRVDAVTLLLASGASARIPTGKGETAAELARKNGHHAISELLIVE